MRKYTNRPPHLFLDNYYYFITAKTRYNAPYLNTNQKKNIFLKVLQVGIKKFNVKIFAWVVLDNHYHLLLKLINGNDLPFFIKNIHNNSARLVNLVDKKVGRNVWFNYWDHCIRDEIDFWKHFNYIHNNPVKHGYVHNPDLLHLHGFSSYNQWIKKNGREWMILCFGQYPVLDFSKPNND